MYAIQIESNQSEKVFCRTKYWSYTNFWIIAWIDAQTYGRRLHRQATSKKVTKITITKEED
jgi:hypothetical protein